jgi:tripartite-type tricarboxylate transporter receptor subunit TctC
MAKPSADLAHDTKTATPAGLGAAGFDPHAHRAGLAPLRRRRFAAGLIAAPWVGSLWGQESGFPARPVRLVVGFPPGGIADIGARLLAEKLGALWGRQVIVDNRGGASGIIAADAVARSPADGHTLLVVLTNHVLLPAFHAKLPYDTIEDFAPVSLMGSSPLLLMASPKLKVETLAELIALAKKDPGITYSTPGDESIHHLSQEQLDSIFGIRLVHVPYKGGAQAMTDAMAGVVDLNVGSPAQSLQQIEGGRLKALAITSAQRSPLLPSVPTFAEAGAPGFASGLWIGVVAPRGTPKPLVAKLESDITGLLARADMKERMTQLGIDVIAGSADEFGRHLRSELKRWSEVAARIGVKPA